MHRRRLPSVKLLSRPGTNFSDLLGQFFLVAHRRHTRGAFCRTAFGASVCRETRRCTACSVAIGPRYRKRPFLAEIFSILSHQVHATGCYRPSPPIPETKQRDELAPVPHSITSSARESSVGGTSRRSAFAVLRLI